MKKFVIRFSIFFIISALIISLYNSLATVSTLKYNGASTAGQINMSFHNAVSEEYNCYFLGNSRIYRDINPDIFTSVKSYNFAHDNDSYNLMYYKLLYLLEHEEKIDYLIIGTDYFQFSFLSDTRNYIYSKKFPSEYSRDFEKLSWLEAQEAIVQDCGPINRMRFNHVSCMYQEDRLPRTSIIRREMDSM